MASEAPSSARPSRAPLVVVCAAAGVYAATFATMGILQYRAGNITYIDTAAFEEMLWKTLRGQFLMTSQWPFNFLGIHVQFSHLFLLPIYVFYPDLRTLMVCQTVALAAGAFPVYGLATQVLRRRWAAAALAVAYLLYTPMQMLDLEGGETYNTFRPITFAVPLLLAAFYYLVRGRLVLFSVLAVLTLTCKQEFGLILFMMGLYAAIFERRRAFGLAWAAVGLVWFGVSLWVITPWVRGEQSHTLSYYSHIGGSMSEILRNLALHPLRWLHYAFVGDNPEVSKLELFQLLFLPVGFVCLLSPATLAMALPTFALCLLSYRYSSWMPWFHYHAPIVPFVFVATVYGLRNLGRLVRRLGKASEASAQRVVAAASAFVLLCSLGTNVAYSKSPLAFRFYDPSSAAYYGSLYVVTPHARKIPEVVAKVPREAVVSASLFLATYFSHHKAVLPFPGGLERDHWWPADYVVLDLRERWLFDQPEQREWFERLQAGSGYQRVPAPEGYAIFRRLEAPDAP